jgi:hypothetical protein
MGAIYIAREDAYRNFTDAEFFDVIKILYPDKRSRRNTKIKIAYINIPKLATGTGKRKKMKIKIKAPKSLSLSEIRRKTGRLNNHFAGFRFATA